MHRPAPPMLVAAPAVVLAAILAVTVGFFGSSSAAPADRPAACPPAPPSSVPAPAATGLRRTGTLSWQVGRLEGADRCRLVVQVITGGRGATPPTVCDPALEVSVGRRGGRLVVTVHTLVAGGPDDPGGGGAEVVCPAIGIEHQLAVTLPAPLTGDTVIDGASGSARRLVDATARFEPSYLPRGYHGPPGSDAQFGVDTRIWSGPPDAFLMLTQDDRPASRRERSSVGHVVLGRPTVRGVRAVAFKDRGFDDLVCLRWAEGRRRLTVCSLGSPRAPLPVAELVRVADGLRPPPARHGP
jgi:hypothetical protein